MSSLSILVTLMVVLVGLFVLPLCFAAVAEVAADVGERDFRQGGDLLPYAVSDAQRGVQRFSLIVSSEPLQRPGQARASARNRRAA